MLKELSQYASYCVFRAIPLCLGLSFSPINPIFAGGPGGLYCGNNQIDSGEQCDGGSCCNIDCTFKGPVVCRHATGTCDTAELCSGSSGECPADMVATPGSTCSHNTTCGSGQCNDFGFCEITSTVAEGTSCTPSVDSCLDGLVGPGQCNGQGSCLPSIPAALAIDSAINLDDQGSTGPTTAATLTADILSPVVQGATVTFTASGIGGSGNYEYKFWRRLASGSNWDMVRDYSTDPTWQWDTGTTAADTYHLLIYVRNEGSSAAYETTRPLLNYNVTPN